MMLAFFDLRYTSAATADNPGSSTHQDFPLLGLHLACLALPIAPNSSLCARRDMYTSQITLDHPGRWLILYQEMLTR